jgi:hypothetical protein
VAFDLHEFDQAFPTIVRYVGLFTTLVLIGFSLAGYYVEAAPGFVAAAGMLLYKTIRNAVEDDGHVEKREKEQSRDLSDW